MHPRVQDYITSLRIEFPGLKVGESRPWWLKAAIGLPGFRRLEWHNNTQTIGMNIWFSDRWDSFSIKEQLIILRHEREHLLQFRRYGVFLMAILYLFVFFPIGLAYFRAKFERKGFAAGLKAQVELYNVYGGTKEKAKERYIEIFCGSKYLWMFPFRKIVAEWFEEDWRAAVAS